MTVIKVNLDTVYMILGLQGETVITIGLTRPMTSDTW